jgi:hypothetical protein
MPAPAGILMLLLGVPARAEEHAIEREARLCLEKAAAPSAMAACTAKAAELWDAEVQRLTAELSSMLDAEGRQALKAAHAEWLRFKTAEQINISMIYGRLKGTAAVLMAAEDRMELIRGRAVELQKYIDLLKDLKP